MSEHTDPARDVETLAEELCRYDDSLHHMEATDDFPCWHCKTKARAVLASDWLAAYVARKQAEVAARAYDDGYNDAVTMARCYGHTDHWPEESEPRNPYRAYLIAGGA